MNAGTGIQTLARVVTLLDSELASASIRGLIIPWQREHPVAFRSAHRRRACDGPLLLVAIDRRRRCFLHSQPERIQPNACSRHVTWTRSEPLHASEADSQTQFQVLRHVP